jgi:hypothetical protein
MCGSTSSSFGPVVRIILLEEARRQFEAEDAWWREHRDAHNLLLEEFEQTLLHLSTLPETGQRYRLSCDKLIRRWLMPRTRCHVYYFHDWQRDALEIHSLWGARRRHGPPL